MKSIGLSETDREQRDARRQMAVYEELSELHELFGAHVRDMRRNLLEAALREKDSGAAGALASPGRGVSSALRFVEDAAREVIDTFRVLAWTPVYIFVEFQKVRGCALNQPRLGVETAFAGPAPPPAAPPRSSAPAPVPACCFPCSFHFIPPHLTPPTIITQSLRTHRPEAIVPESAASSRAAGRSLLRKRRNSS